MKIDSSELEKVINSVLDEYTDEVKEVVLNTAKSVADRGVEELRQVNMPSANSTGDAMPSSRRQWKNYSQSWSVQNKSNNKEAKFIVYNKKYYRLTHLLEYGHATRNGLRTRGFQHIKPVEEKCQSEFVQELEEIL